LLRHRRRVVRGASRSRATRTTRAPSYHFRRIDTGHSPDRAFFAWRSATRSTSCGLAGRRRSSLVRRPTALLGFVPFAGLIPPTGGRATLRCLGGRSRAAGSASVPAACRRFTIELGISAGPGPRVVRAPASAPIDFRRGDRPPVGESSDLQKRSAGDGVASTSGLRLPSAIRLPGTVWPDARSCLGLCLLQGCGHISTCIGPGSTPVPIINPRTRDAGNSFARGDSYPLMGFATRLLDGNVSGAARRSDRDREGALGLRSGASSLQRIEGLMPCRSARITETRSGRLPV
jgi:hypothetical protein